MPTTSGDLGAQPEGPEDINLLDQRPSARALVIGRTGYLIDQVIAGSTATNEAAHPHTQEVVGSR